MDTIKCYGCIYEIEDGEIVYYYNDLVFCSEECMIRYLIDKYIVYEDYWYKED